MNKQPYVFDKTALAHILAQSYQNVDIKTASKVVELFFEQITTALVCGDRIELRGFGSMVVRKRNAKIVRNPKTLKQVNVDPKGSLYFRASKELLKELNNGSLNGNNRAKSA